MTNSHGSFIWYELMTSDPDAAGAFYGEAIGWTVGSFGGATLNGPGDYRIFTAPDGEGVGGMMKLPDCDLAPGWFGYIGVDDVDAAVASLVEAGGSVNMPAQDLPGVGRMAMVADPQGVTFYLMRGASPEASTAFKRMALGHGEWNELHATDDAAALDFYARQFGWTKEGAMPMGPMGDYSFLGHAGGVIGAVMRTPDGQPRWHYYFRVGDIDEAGARITGAGGTIAHGPTEVPGGDFIIIAHDPQGARFGIVGSRAKQGADA